MTPRWSIPLLLVVLTGCSSSTRVVRLDMGGGRPLIHVPRGGQESVELDDDDFEEAMTELARDVRPSARPLESARRLFGVAPRSGAYAYEKGSRRIVPLEKENSLEPAEPPVDAELTRAYLRWCERTLRPGDCLRLLVDGSLVNGDGKYALAMAIAQGSVLDETKEAFRDMVDPEAMVATVVGAMTVYGMLWVLPEPFSKGVAAVLTVALMGYLGWETVRSLVQGWVQLVEVVDRATAFEEIRAAGERYGQVMGQNAARIFAMLSMAAVGGTAAQVAAKLPRLPGAGPAAMLVEAEAGIQYGAVAQVQSVFINAEGAASSARRGPIPISES